MQVVGISQVWCVMSHLRIHGIVPYIAMHIPRQANMSDTLPKERWDDFARILSHPLATSHNILSPPTTRIES